MTDVTVMTRQDQTWKATHVFTRWPNASTCACHAGGIRRVPVDIA
ncbi:MAG: hypothetical protein WCG47_12155 [Dermatophilaceae bacterium]